MTIIINTIVTESAKMNLYVKFRPTTTHANQKHDSEEDDVDDEDPLKFSNFFFFLEQQQQLQDLSLSSEEESRSNTRLFNSVATEEELIY